MEPKRDDEYRDNTRYLVQCDQCKAWMLIVEGMRRICRDCNARLGQATNLKSEEEKHKAELRAWWNEERRLAGSREVG
jgi:hypothetical protein